MPDVVNDCLGLAQYLTQHLGREATDYLLTIPLSTDEWKEAKGILLQQAAPKSKLPSRHTKEGAIRDCVEIFVDSQPTDRFLVANLS